MTRRRTTLAVIIVALALIAAATICSRMAARKDVSELVARALTRDAGMNYVAYVVNTAQNDGKSIETRATVYHQGSTEKVEYSGKAGRRVWSMLRDGKSYTYLPKANQVLVGETSKVLSNTQRSQLLVQNYKIVSDGTDKVAGRDVYVVDISSRYGARPRKKLWIDTQHLTVLKSVDYSAAGDVRGSTEMISIRYNAKILPDTFEVPAEKSVKMVMVCKSAKSSKLFKGLGFPIRVPQYVPAGYVIEGYHLFSSQCNCNHKSAQITYSDGLNVISVFQTPNMTSCKAGGCNMTDNAGCGGCAVENCDMAKIGQTTHSDRTVVVVGDLLSEDIKKIAESVR